MTGMVEPPKNPQALAQAVADDMMPRDHVFQAHGMELLTVGPGQATITMTVRDDMVNGHDLCHGGVLFTIADAAMAYASNAYNQVAVAVGATITFVASATIGERLTAAAEEQTVFGRNAVYDIRITAGNGRLVAMVRGQTRRVAGTVIQGRADTNQTP